jgi:hypothetical protein
MTKDNPPEVKNFRTIRGLLIGDTLLRDIVPERVELAKELTGFEEAIESDWRIEINRDEDRRLTHILVVDVAHESEGSFPFRHVEP